MLGNNNNSLGSAFSCAYVIFYQLGFTFMRFGGLIAAVVLAAIAAVIVLRMSSGSSQPVASTTSSAPVQQEIATTQIYVASQPIPIGTSITADMLTLQPWPSHLVLDGFIASDSEQKVEGMVSRSAFQAQEPILLSKLSNPADPNFLAGALPKGMRVMTLQTNEIEGVAGFVFPGDFVDVMLTHTITKYVTPPGEEDLQQQTDTVTETLITNVKVLAVDQRASGTNATDPNGNLLIPRTVSVMVSPTDAQRLRLAQQKGTLTLVLRSLADRESADLLIATTDKDISSYPSLDAGAGVSSGNVVVVRGTARGEQKASTPAFIPQPAPAAAP